MSNRTETNWTQRAKNQFFSMQVPAHIAGVKATTHTQREKNDLNRRRRQKEDLLAEQDRACEAYDRAQDDLNEFQRQVEAYKAADRVKDPSNEDRETMLVVKRSVDSITLNGPSHGVSDMERKIAVHALALKKKRDDAMKAYDESGKVCKGSIQPKEFDHLILAL